jgi:NADH:ubiquinone reductase (H+-translocating)
MHTVIVGGGFAGIRAALEISKRQLGKVTLISDQPDFIHHATMYSTIAGHDKAESVISLEDIFANHHDIKVIHDSLSSVDPDRHLAVCKKRSYSYDSLILALGSTSNFFDVKGAAKHTIGINNLKDIDTLHHHIKNEILHDKHLDKNYIIVGGGTTGVEVAGALANYLKDLSVQYLTKRAKVNITIAEVSPRLLPQYSKMASSKVTARLKKLGVTVRTSTAVTKIDDHYAVIGGKKVPTQTVIWTSGSSNNPFFARNRAYFQLAKNGRVVVNPYLEAYRDIYVLGDNADITHTGTAYSAIDTGEFIAEHLLRKVTDRPLRAFRGKKHTVSVPVGDDWAYIESHGIYVDNILGHWLRRYLELKSYRKLLAPNMAQAAWKSHNRKTSL